MRTAAVLPVVILLTAATAPADDALRTPRVVSERTVDCYSVPAILDSILTPDMTQKQKAEAIYRFVRDYRWHWPSVREGDLASNFEYGVVYDPVKLLNVYGYGYCFQTSVILETLYQQAGLEARVCGIGGHSVCEVFYDGAYHLYDAEMLGYAKLPDGTVANKDQLGRMPFSLIVEPGAAGRSPFAGTKDPRVPYESNVILAALYASRGNNYSRHDKIRLGHRMDVTLLPGMRLVRGWKPAGKWNYDGGHAMELKIGYMDPAVGPRDPFRGTRYANGHLLYQPDLTAATEEYPAGVWEQRNIARDAEGIRPAESGKPASAVFRVRLPYVIVGAPTDIDGKGGVRHVGAAVLSARVRRGDGDAAGISVSTDGGRTWQSVWKSEAPGRAEVCLDLSEQLAGRYEYLVRLEMKAGGDPASCRVERFGLRTNFQCNPHALPAVGPGETKMTFKLGDGTETHEFVPTLATAEGFLRDAYAVRNIRFMPGRVTTGAGDWGEIVYLLTPPADGTIDAFTSQVGCRREPHLLDPGDTFEVHYAVGEPDGWQQIGADDWPVESQHWSSFLNCRVRLDRPAERVFVKIRYRTAAHASIQRAKFVLNWRPAGSGSGMPGRGVRVEHAWHEGGELKRFEKVLARAPAEYVVSAGDLVDNEFIGIEPVRASGAVWWDLPDIPAPALKPNAHVVPAMKAEMQGSLRRIDADPLKALPAAVQSDIEWLAGSAKQAAEMFANRDRYPLPDSDGVADRVMGQAGKLLKLDRRPAEGDVIKLLKGIEDAADPANRAALAAALVLVGDKRGRRPLADALAAGDPAKLLDPLVVLMRVDAKAAGPIVTKVLKHDDRYLRQNFLARVLDRPIDTTPAELLAGLSDPCRWVRLSTLRQLRRGPRADAVPMLRKMAESDPLAFLQAEAASVLSATASGK